MTQGKKDPVDNEDNRHYYQKLEDRFDQVWESAMSTYRTNTIINIIVVGIGIILIANGLIFQWYDNFVYHHPTASPKSTTHGQANVTSTNSNTTDGQASVLASVLASVMGTNSNTTDDQTDVTSANSNTTDDQTDVTSANSNATDDQTDVTSANSNATDDQTDVTSANSNSENEPNIPNYSGLISSSTGLATIVGLFFYRSQAHVQRAFTNLALTNFISTANMWGFKRLDWYYWAKYRVPTLKPNHPDLRKAGSFESVKDIKWTEYEVLLDKMQVLTKEYSAQLYKKTRLMEDPTEQEKKEKKKDDNTSSDKGEDASKTDTTSTDTKNQKP
jgi:hypothetical protein